MTTKLTVIILIVFVGIYEETQAACPTIISRQAWGAKAAKSKQNFAQNPPPYVVIHHSETPSCTTSDSCTRRVKNIQDFHINSRGWSDIGYNFLIGGDGNVYEGRGWGIRGAHVPKYNSRSIGICMIGNFQSSTPPSNQMEALKNLISCGTDSNKIASDYHLIGHRQGKDTDCPGDALYNLVKTMPHWDRNPN
ncbi:unnamed protein product [Psylliodes chrysocephalus]|uniref:Peptidoglycan-recognition protein n=1 Tax=Psylliodes chrysocephalus TaxID=3402493 RepID=A0A9P0G931_9CUCU|nr:unnamed protein product [Psylliodes chrysocephala]